ncbi:hypothetical protein GCM10023085_13800 [Actinomadura viridis]|uniref:Uncharacterized protein n=1 Tax=Actinomadura viridis TaxID=58110 RepID=A0A931GMY2_9ACTN|nr:hypothetical protein [Actinomadura viridis]MBG6093753.1 hypothetical protein [Actinomadura viridis]
MDRPFDHVPFLCPHGHRLAPGRVIVGWSPCVCPPCAGRGRGLRGHRTYLCLACKDDRMTTMCFQPHHVRPEGAASRRP